jgi:hypothetical protein
MDGAFLMYPGMCAYAVYLRKKCVMDNTHSNYYVVDCSVKSSQRAEREFGCYSPAALELALADRFAHGARRSLPRRAWYPGRPSGLRLVPSAATFTISSRY